MKSNILKLILLGILIISAGMNAFAQDDSTYYPNEPEDTSLIAPPPPSSTPPVIIDETDTSGVSDVNDYDG